MSVARIGSTSDTLTNRYILQAKRVPVPMKRRKVAIAGAGLAGLVAVAMTSIGHTAVAATPNPVSPATTVLIDTMESELHRAMNSLGTANDATQQPGSPAGVAAGVEQPKPYFLSYAVSDSDAIAMTAQFGAIT